MEEITNLLSTFSTWAISITAIVAALTAVFKPLRTFVLNIFKKAAGDRDKKIVSAIHDETERIKVDLAKEIKDVSKKCDTNERDRLQQVIFKFGNYARKRQEISGEEFRFLQKSFAKYTELEGNDIAHDEYEFVVDYYNRRGWTDWRYKE